MLHLSVFVEGQAAHLFPECIRNAVLLNVKCIPCSPEGRFPPLRGDIKGWRKVTMKEGGRCCCVWLQAEMGHVTV